MCQFGPIGDEVDLRDPASNDGDGQDPGRCPARRAGDGTDRPIHDRDAGQRSERPSRLEDVSCDSLRADHRRAGERRPPSDVDAEDDLGIEDLEQGFEAAGPAAERKASTTRRWVGRSASGVIAVPRTRRRARLAS